MTPRILFFAAAALAAPAFGAGTFSVVQRAKVGGTGGFDYVYVDASGGKLYIPRGDRVTVFDAATLAPAGVIADTPSVHGAVVDPASHHGFCSSNPVVMWDTRDLSVMKRIPVQGNPDGILFDPATERVLVLSHRAPNVTAIDAKSGAVVGTIDLGGAPEEGASDGQGTVYIDLEDQAKVAVVDMRAMKQTGEYALGEQGGGPAGLALDAKHHVLFACCRDPHNAIMLDASTGKILATLPIGAGVDSAAFDPATGEAFSSNRDGTLTVIREKSPTDFEVEQNVATQAGAKTCSLDPTTHRIYLITADLAAGGATAPKDGGGRGKGKGKGRARFAPDSFTILVVARAGE